jgi:hypothetical protein
MMKLRKRKKPSRRGRKIFKLKKDERQVEKGKPERISSISRGNERLRSQEKETYHVE